MEDHSERWAHVGDLVTAQVEEIGGSLAKLAVEAGVSDKFIKGLMDGRPGDRRRDPVKRLGHRFGWKHDWLNRVLSGLEPEPLPADRPHDLPTRVAQLEEQVAELIASVLDLQNRQVKGARSGTPRVDRSKQAAP